MRKRVFWGLVGVAAMLALWALCIEPARLEERRVAVRIDGFPSMTIGMVSDIHAGSNFVDQERIRRVVRILNAGQPDLIALLGDYVTENRLAAPIPAEQTASWLGELRAPGGVFAVLGNHDWWQDGPGITRSLQGAGLRVLEGEFATTEVRGQRLWVLGVPDATTRGAFVEDALARAPRGAPVLALTHSPDIFPRVPEHVRLTLAGHTHGGQVRFPLLGALVVPSRYGQRYAQGHISEGNRHLYVTSGLGMSIFPIRFGVPPEVVFLKIN